MLAHKNKKSILTKTVTPRLMRWAAAAAVLATLGTARGADSALPSVPGVGFTATPVQPVALVVDSGTDQNGRLSMAVNKTAIITTKTKVSRVSVGQPDIADVLGVGPTTLLVTGKKYGTTQIIVWDEKEQSQVIDVSVDFDIQALRDEFKKTFPDSPITVDVINGQITLKGRVPNLKMAEQAARVAQAYSKDVINFLEVGGGQQIVLGVQFIEMSRSASNQLGFSALFNDGHNSFGFLNGQTGSINGFGSAVATPITIFGSGNIGGTAFQAFLSALKSNSLARTLAEPNLVAVSGEDASFLAGGEIPVPVPQSGAGGSSTITIEYKEFGVRLKYNAVVLGDGRIRMKVEPEVSDLDYNNTTSVQGQAVPGLRTRRVSSIVEMNEGQTLALAGLLQRSVNMKNTATPLLGDLPVLGAMFRNVSYTRSETELVILVTPKLASAMNPDQVPAAPGANWRYPNEAQLYGLADLGGPTAKDGAVKTPDSSEVAPRYVGPNGFDEPAALQTPVAQADDKK